MNKLKLFWQKIRDIFGFRKNTRYVSDYLNQANMRSGVFMSAVIFLLEIWLLLRKLDKYIIPTMNNPENTYSLFRVIYMNTSNFWLLLSFGLAMMFYCIQYRSFNQSIKRHIPTFVAAFISIVFCCMMPLEFKFATRAITGVTLYLLISLYASVFAFNVAVIGASIYRWKGGKKQRILSVLVIALFALVCLSFGVKVSYSDFSSVRKINGELVANPDYKQVICFLMMAIYVGCLLIWKPFVSVGILGAVFLGFYILLDKTVSIRNFPEGDQVNYITFFISLTMVCISIYDQRVSEAKKDEELELLATRDTLTGLYSYEYFTTLVGRQIQDESVKLDEWIYLFMDITSFKIFNDQRGFEEGNKFLKDVGDVLTQEFGDGALISRQSDDHYVVFCPNENIEEKLTSINNEIERLDLDIRPGIKVGGYVLRDKKEDPHESVEKARYSCTELKNHGFGNFLKYDQKMHDNYRLIQYIVRHVDEAIANDYIKAYYQPVAWSKDKTLCGVEALARWVDPKYGFLTPYLFIGALEDSQLIYKLDIAVLTVVCKDIRRNIDNNLPVIPVSINFSRYDFAVVDIVSMIDEVVTKYNVPKDYLHIEITESALTRDEDNLKKAMDRLHQLGYAIWLDDFGSGYSSFNVLKDFNFDLLKLDMKFLVGFEGNARAKILIKSVVQLADQIGMKTLCEGVETPEEAEFLKSVNCGRLQGFLIGKPMPYDELKEKIINKHYTLSKTL